MVNVNVTLDGREKSVVYDMMSVKYQTVMGMANVPMENVSVLEVLKENFVKKVSAGFVLTSMYILCNVLETFYILRST